MIRLNRQLQAGDFQHRFVFEEPVETAQAGKVAKVTSWREFGRRWCAIFSQGSREVWNARQYNAETELVIACPGHIAVTPAMRLNDGAGRLLDILGVQGADGRTPAKAETVFLLCKEGTSKGA